jgi:hypothetical protein
MAELEIVIKGNDQASGVIDGLNGALNSFVNIVAGAAVAGVAALGAGLVSSVAAAMEAQDGLAELEAVIESTGGKAGITAEYAQELASSFQNLTKFSDDTVLAGESMLLTFTNIGQDVFPFATQAMLNMAEKFGSVDQAAVQLGKALNDPVNGVSALKRIGVSLNETQAEMVTKMMAVGDVAGAQMVILGELETEFGGLAQAAGGTLSGQFEILKNRFGDMQEEIGGALLPVLTLMADKLYELQDSAAVATALDAIKTGIQSVVEVLTPLVNGEPQLALQRFQAELMKLGLDPAQIESISTSITSIVDSASRIGEAFGEMFGGANIDGATGFALAMSEVATAVERIAGFVEQVQQVVSAVSNSPLAQLGGQFLSAATITPSEMVSTGQSVMSLANAPGIAAQGIAGGNGADAATTDLLGQIVSGITGLGGIFSSQPPQQTVVNIDSQPLVNIVSSKIGGQVAGYKAMGRPSKLQ